jgi:hypothetical protein
MILEARASRDVMNVIETRAIVEWEPGQDLWQDSREVITPARIVKERGRGTIIRNERDVQMLLDYQAAMQREVRAGIGLSENGRMTDMWFRIQAQSARTIEEYGAHFVGHIMTAPQALSPEWAWPLFSSTPQEYHIMATMRNDEVEIWYLSRIWGEDDSTPAAYQPVPKEWIVYPGVECFIAPAEGLNDDLNTAKRIFGNAVVGERISNLENPGGFITRVAESETDLPNPVRTQEQWLRPKEVQEQVNRRIAEISSRIDPLNARVAEFLAEYDKGDVLAITLGLAPVETECYRLWAIVLHQAWRKMTHMGRESAEGTREQAALAGLLAALRWEHPMERTADPIQWQRDR